MTKLKKISDDLLYFFASDRAILLLCMSIALIFWLLVKLSKSFKSYYDTPISYELPEGRTFLELPPQTVKVALNGRGWDLLSYYLSDEKASVSFTLDQSESQSIFASDIRDQLAGVISPLEVNEVATNQIRIQLGESGTKHVPIILNTDISYESGFQQQQSPRLEPDSIVINGPQALLDSLNYWLTEPLILKKVRTNIEQELPLAAPNSDVIRLQDDKVKVTIPVEAFTEKSLMVPVQILHAPDSLQLFPRKVDVRVSCTVGLSQFETLSKADFKIVADLKDIPVRAEKNTVPLILTEQPIYVRNVKFSPNSMEFFFVEKEKSEE